MKKKKNVFFFTKIQSRFKNNYAPLQFKGKKNNKYSYEYSSSFPKFFELKGL